MTLSSSARSVHATLAPGGDVRVVHRRLPRTCLTNHVLPVIVHGPSAARALMQCGGRDVAWQRVGAGAVDPARAQAGALSCCGGSSGQLPWCHYTSSCPRMYSYLCNWLSSMRPNIQENEMTSVNA